MESSPFPSCSEDMLHCQKRPGSCRSRIADAWRIGEQGSLRAAEHVSPRSLILWSRLVFARERFIFAATFGHIAHRPTCAFGLNRRTRPVDCMLCFWCTGVPNSMQRCLLRACGKRAVGSGGASASSGVVPAGAAAKRVQSTSRLHFLLHPEAPNLIKASFRALLSHHRAQHVSESVG